MHVSRRLVVVRDGLAHQHQFFSRRRMHGARRIPLRLGELRFDSDGGDLDQLRRLRTGDVDADDTIVRRVDD